MKNQVLSLVITNFLFVSLIISSCQEKCDTPSGGIIYVSFIDKISGIALPDSIVRTRAMAITNLAVQPDISNFGTINVDFSYHTCTRDTILLDIFWDGTLIETVRFRLFDIEEACDNTRCCDPCYVVDVRDINTTNQSELL